MSSDSTLLSEIFAKYREGNLAGAEADCLKILSSDTSSADAHHVLGLISLQRGDTFQAFEQIAKAIEISPDTAAYHCSLGNLYLKNSDINKAFKAFQQAINLNPDFAEAHFSTGMILQRAGQLEIAAEAYRNALKASPDYPDANCNLGVVLHTLGQFDDAALYYRKALSFDPGNFHIDYNLAGTFMELQQYSLAEKHLRKVIGAKPDLFEAQFNLGIVLTKQGNRAEAIECYRHAVRLKPDHTDALNNLGTLLTAQGDYKDSINALNNALIKAPDNPKIHFNMGNALKENRQYTHAVHSFMHALKLDPGFSKAHSELCRCNQIICDWRNNACSSEKLADLTKECLDQQTESPIYPFDALSLPFTPELQRDIARSHAKTISNNAGRNDQFRNYHPIESRARLRIGYVSQKFNNHAGAHLIASLFGLHDREKYEIFAYSIGDDDGSIYRQRIMQGCEHFIDISRDSFSSAARRIHDDGINILIDLGVYNTFSRTEIFALRPAPLQISYLGYPGTSGSDFYDYILTDRIVTPPDQQQWYTEKFAYLPHSYQVNDHELELPRTIPGRSDCGLPENAFVFCSFNNSYKIEPDIFSVWMRILSRVPDSVLWLLDHSPEASSNLRREAAQRGVAGERIIFAEKQPKDRHLARHQHAGLFLDTLYYNAHTTASDSLRIGVPVVTLPGSTFASRVGASLLEAVNLPEMITASKEQYEELAVNFATNASFAADICNKLETSLETCPLFDTPRFARHLEQAYETLWAEYLSTRQIAD